MNRESGIGNRAFEVVDDETLLVGFREDEHAPIVDHRDLDVWKTAMALTTDVYKATSNFPRDERFGLTSQARRAAVSIPANIAEGYGRETSGSYIQFVRIAQGSAREIETLLEVSRQLGYLNDAPHAGLNDRLTRVTKMLGRLLRAIERRNRQ